MKKRVSWSKPLWENGNNTIPVKGSSVVRITRSNTRRDGRGPGNVQNSEDDGLAEKGGGLWSRVLLFGGTFTFEINFLPSCGKFQKNTFQISFYKNYLAPIDH